MAARRMQPDPEARVRGEPTVPPSAAGNGAHAAGDAVLTAARWRHFIGAQTGWRRRGLACLAGSLSVLAMAPFFLWPVLFLTLPVLVWLIDAPPAALKPLRAAAHDGWWFGFGYFFFGLFWIGEAFLVEAEIFAWMIPFAITLMPAGLALFTGAACAGARRFWKPGLSRVFVLAIGLAVMEYLRGHVFTGFPWNVLGYALTGDDIAMQAAAIFGIYGLTLWTIVICATPLVMLASAAPRRDAAAAIACLTLLPLAALYAYGLAVLPTTQLETVDGVTIRIVQPSVPQHFKWARDKQGEIFNDHLILSRTNEAGQTVGLAGITHVVWPEAAMPFLPLATPQALAAIAELLPEKTYLIAGALRLERSTAGDEIRPGVAARSKVFNSMIVFGPDGEASAIYDKLHLVPFGEYLPFTQTLEWLGLEALTRIRGGFAVGPSPRPLLAVPGLPAVGPLICYEAIFPGAVIQTNERPDLLINVTNDGWFGNTTGPHQHMHQSRLRAVEEGLPLVRAANNGVTAMIDPYGRVIKSIGLNIRGVIDVSLPRRAPMTVYARYGELSFFVLLMIFTLAARCLLPYPVSSIVFVR